MEILKAIADNKPVLEALQKLLEAEFETPLTEVDALTDEEIGQRVRSRLYGKRAIKSAFQKIAQHRTKKEEPRPEHPGR